MANHQLALAEVIRALRQELMEAQATSEDEALRLRLGEVKIEAAVVVTDEVVGRGGIRFWVVEAGGTASKTNEAVQRVYITLHPTTDFDVARHADEAPR